MMGMPDNPIRQFPAHKKLGAEYELRRKGDKESGIMGQLTEQQVTVARLYNDAIFDFELTRLTKLCPVEFTITARYLKRWIPEAVVVAEIGVGGGHYTKMLARQNCSIHLIDVSQRLLEAVAAKLREAKIDKQIKGIDLASATELDCLETGSFDAVLMLGPLYHLCKAEERKQAVNEAARILKKDGFLFAAGINRLAYLRDLFRESPLQASVRQEFHKQYLQDGNLDPQHAPPIGFAHLTTVYEFRQLFEDRFEEIGMIGTESFTGIWQNILADLPETEKDAWLELVEQTATTPEGLAASDHFLYIGKKK